jgi:Glycosyl transferase family 11
MIFVDGGYYQGGALWSTLFPPRAMNLQPELRQKARDFLRNAVGGSPSVPVFVHVRRGDYVTYTGYGLNGLVLPERYYRQAMLEMERRLGPIHLIFVSDDTDWVTATFADIERKSIVSFSEALDFAIMAECRAGIVSSSTFSLGAALLMNQPELVIAPRYWLGYRVHQWLPAGIRFDHPRIVYIHVADSQESPAEAAGAGTL